MSTTLPSLCFSVFESTVHSIKSVCLSQTNATRYKYAKDRSQRMVVIPRYEPVFVEPNLKEYETQVP